MLEPLDCEIRISTFFEHCLGFAVFKPLSVGFEDSSNLTQFQTKFR